MEMVLNNRTITAAEALQYGLVNRVTPVENCLTEALKLAAQIAARAPLAVQFGKEAVNNVFESSLTQGLLDERRAFYTLFATDDQKEGMAAFIEKREPDWKGK
jgi:enoyl-CoA hydratase